MTQGNLPQILLPSSVPSTISVELTLTHQAPAEDLVTELFLFSDVATKAHSHSNYLLIHVF